MSLCCRSVHCTAPAANTSCVLGKPVDLEIQTNSLLGWVTIDVIVQNVFLGSASGISSGSTMEWSHNGCSLYTAICPLETGFLVTGRRCTKWPCRCLPTLILIHGGFWNQMPWKGGLTVYMRGTLVYALGQHSKKELKLLFLGVVFKILNGCWIITEFYSLQPGRNTTVAFGIWRVSLVLFRLETFDTAL